LLVGFAGMPMSKANRHAQSKDPYTHARDTFNAEQTHQRATFFWLATAPTNSKSLILFTRQLQ
jgi:hypothetical protein